MNKPKPPLPSIYWEVTTKCNYSCTYCSQKLYTKLFWKHASNDVVDAMLDYIQTLKSSWLINVSGGEPMIHPRFMEVCKAIAANGHKFSTTTNFSLPIRKLKELVSILGDQIFFISASLHPTQLKNIDDFINKAIEFNSIISPQTDFFITSVLVEEDFELLKDVKARLENAGIKFELSPLTSFNKYVKYDDPEIENYIQENGLKNANKIRNKNLFGKRCFTGKLFFYVRVNGDVSRCFNLQPGYFLGNIVKGTFKPFDTVKPCMALKCTCTAPANRNMIRFDERMPFTTVAKSVIEGSFMNLKNFKDLKILGNKE